MKIRKMGTELVHADGETEEKTDRRTEMTRLIVFFTIIRTLLNI